MNLIKNCPVCNSEIFYKNKYNYKNAIKRNTKCIKCRSVGINLGKCTTEETKLKMRNSLKGVGATGKHVNCTNCSKSIYKSGWELKKNKKLFCSHQCNSEHMRIPKVKVVCSYTGCKNEFYRHSRDLIRWNSIVYCSASCSARASLKKIQSAPIRQKRTLPELKFLNMLEKYEIKYFFQKSVEWKLGWKKWFDFYIPKHNILIEIDGVYWHGKNLKYDELNNQQKRTRDNDIIKDNLAIESGYSLIRIWSDEIDNFNIKNLL